MNNKTIYSTFYVILKLFSLWYFTIGHYKSNLKIRADVQETSMLYTCFMCTVKILDTHTLFVGRVVVGT